MDLQERRQIDLAARVSRARVRARPWRSIVAGLIALSGAVAAEFWGVGSWHQLREHGHLSAKLIFICGVVALLGFGIASVVGLSGKAWGVLRPVIGQAHAGILRYLLLLAGVFTILVITLAIWGVSPGRLVVGGAVTGVLLGIAAQQSLSNIFAGLVLLFASPFRVGDRVRFQAGALSGGIEGIVTDLSLTYVGMETDQGRILLPNSQALNAAVLLLPGPAAASPPAPAEAASPGAASAAPASPTASPGAASPASASSAGDDGPPSLVPKPGEPPG